MRKFSKIFETKEKILDVIGIEEADIKDICQDLIDEYDFSFKIIPQWISKSGTVYYKSNQSSESYPSLLVSLERELDYESKTDKDPRNWNGGVYYESDANVIKVIYETISRLESLLDKGDIKVFYSIRSMGDIQLRITSSIERSTLPIDVENVINFIEKIDGLDLPYPEYEIGRTWSQGNKRSIAIVPILSSRFNTDPPGDFIIARIIKNNNHNRDYYKSVQYNTLDLVKSANLVIRKLRDACEKGDVKSSDIKAEYYDENDSEFSDGYVYIECNGVKLIKIRSSVDRITKSKVKLSSGIFKDIFLEVVFLKLEMDIEILVEKGHGDD